MATLDPLSLPPFLPWVLALHLAPLVHLAASRALSPCYRTSYVLMYVMVTAIAWTLALVLGALAPHKAFLWAPLALPLVLWLGLLRGGAHRRGPGGDSCPRP